jgi:hypothetical protein
MSFFDQYIFHILVFSPLAASFFIMLIPTADLGSKLTISKFFSIIGFLAFLRLFVLFINHDMPPETMLSFGTNNLNINLALFISKYNIFLYGVASLTLLANMFMYEINDTKTNIHQVSPFLLTFFLYVSFGQNDLRVALPILSIANFLVYFMIGYTNKIRRGSTIFQMGVFLFSCDALALVLLQIPHNYTGSSSLTFFTILLLTPGLARLCLPMIAPFTKKLIINVDELEGSFLIIFQQLSGFLILIFVKNDLIEIPPFLSGSIAVIALIGAIYIGLIAIIDHKIKLLPYYFLNYYSSLVATVLFASLSDDIWFITISLFITNIACFFFATRFLVVIDYYRSLDCNTSQLRLLSFVAISIFIGAPGLGIGTSLWALLYQFISFDIVPSHGNEGIFYYGYVAWLIALLFLCCAFILCMREEISSRYSQETGTLQPIKASMLLSPILIALLSWLIPLVTFYTASKGL